MTSAHHDPIMNHKGQFVPGNKAASSAIISSAGDSSAIISPRWLWDRVVGKPTQQIIESRGADSELSQLLQSLAGDGAE